VVSYHGPCGPVVAVALASPRSSEPTTDLRPERSDTTNGDATILGAARRVLAAMISNCRVRSWDLSAGRIPVVVVAWV
jgi:hypothetical protein